MTTQILDATKQHFSGCTVDWDEYSDIFTVVWSGWSDVPHEERLIQLQLVLAQIGELGRFKHVFTLTPAELAIFHSI